MKENEEIFDAYLEHEASLSDERMEGIIQRGTSLHMPVVSEGNEEESPTTPRNLPPVHAPAQPKSGARAPPRALLLPSEKKAQIQKKEEEKQTRAKELAEAKAKEAEKENTLAAEAGEGKAEKDPNVSLVSAGSPEEWEDTVEMASVDASHAEGGMYGDAAPLLSISESHAGDIRKDMEFLGLRMDGLDVKNQTTSEMVAAIAKKIDEIKASNNQFQTELMGRIRALERKLAHDDPITHSAKEVTEKIIPTRAVSSSSSRPEPDASGDSSTKSSTFAERLRAKRGQT